MLHYIAFLVVKWAYSHTVHIVELFSDPLLTNFHRQMIELYSSDDNQGKIRPETVKLMRTDFGPPNTFPRFSLIFIHTCKTYKKYMLHPTLVNELKDWLFFQIRHKHSFCNWLKNSFAKIIELCLPRFEGFSPKVWLFWPWKIGTLWTHSPFPSIPSQSNFYIEILGWFAVL